MWVILAGIAASIIALAAVFNLRHDSPLSATHFEKSNAELVAGNIISYMTGVKQAIEVGSHHSTENIAITPYEIKNNLNYQLLSYVDYRAALIYSSNDMYELVSWDKVLIEKKTNDDMILNSLAMKFGTLDSSVKAFPVIIKNIDKDIDKCNPIVVNNYNFSTSSADAYKQIWLNACNGKNIKDFSFGKYNILLKIVK